MRREGEHCRQERTTLAARRNQKAVTAVSPLSCTMTGTIMTVGPRTILENKQKHHDPVVDSISCKHQVHGVDQHGVDQAGRRTTCTGRVVSTGRGRKQKARPCRGGASGEMSAATAPQGTRRLENRGLCAADSAAREPPARHCATRNTRSAGPVLSGLPLLALLATRADSGRLPV